MTRAVVMMLVLTGVWTGGQAPPGFTSGEVPTPDGERLYFERGGSGDRAVILLGRLFTLEQFRWLADHYTVVSFDMRDRGRSSIVIDGSRITLEADVEDIETVRRHFGLERVSVMGYSYLGKVAVMYAVAHPDRVERIVQLGPVAPTFGTDYQARWVATDDARDPAGIAQLRAMREESRHLTHPREYCEDEWRVSRVNLVGDPSRVGTLGPSPCTMPNEWPTLLARHMRHHFVESTQNHVMDRAAVARLQTPVLTIHGTRDRNAPYGAGRDWAFLLPQGRLLTVDGAAHQVFSEFPDIVMPAVRTFLDGGWPAGATRVTEDPR